MVEQHKQMERCEDATRLIELESKATIILNSDNPYKPNILENYTVFVDIEKLYPDNSPPSGKNHKLVIDVHNRFIGEFNSAIKSSLYDSSVKTIPDKSKVYIDKSLKTVSKSILKSRYDIVKRMEDSDYIITHNHIENKYKRKILFCSYDREKYPYAIINHKLKTIFIVPPFTDNFLRHLDPFYSTLADKYPNHVDMICPKGSSNCTAHVLCEYYMFFINKDIFDIGIYILNNLNKVRIRTIYDINSAGLERITDNHLYNLYSILCLDASEENHKKLDFYLRALANFDWEYNLIELTIPFIIANNKHDLPRGNIGKDTMHYKYNGQSQEGRTIIQKIRLMYNSLTSLYANPAANGIKNREILQSFIRKIFSLKDYTMQFNDVADAMRHVTPLIFNTIFNNSKITLK